MTSEEFVEYIGGVFNNALSIVKAKNKDYSGDKNPFKNLMLCEEAGITSVENGILIRMFDKMGRVSNLLNESVGMKEVNESIEDTLIDLINYAAILITYRNFKYSGPYNQGKRHERLGCSVSEPV